MSGDALEQLVALADRARRLDQRLDQLTGVSAGRETAWPLTPGQERFWWTYLARPDARFHHCPMGLRLVGRLDTRTLAEAVADLTDRQDALRVRVVEGPDGVVRQQVMAAGTVPAPFSTVDLGGENAPAPAARLQELLSADVRAPFSPADAPLWRLTLFRLADQEHHLHLVVHHLISDAAGIGVMFRDLGELYRARVDGCAPALPDLRGGYAASVRRRTDDLSPARAAAAAYWLDRLATPPPLLELPADRPRPAAPTQHGALWRWTIPAAAVTPLRSGAAGHGATLAAALLAALALVAQRATGQNDLVIGSMLSGRRDRAENALVACLAEVVALRLQVEPAGPAVQLLHTCADALVGALRHASCPFQEVVSRLRLARDYRRPALFSVLFILQNTSGEIDSAFAPLHGEMVDEAEHRAASEFDMYLQVRESASGLSLSIEYSTDLFDLATIQRLAAAYTAALQALGSSWSQLPEEIALPGFAAPDAPNDTPLALALAGMRPVSFPELFLEQAEAWPERNALVDGGRQLTYRELRAAALTVADQLREAGIGRGARVGVHMRRSVDAIAALIGIQAAGAAYVPLDPAYPKERLTFMVADAGLRAVIMDAAADRTAADALLGTRVRLLRFQHARADRVLHPPEPPGLGDLAYAIYTSGSTGEPKAVAVDHRSLSNLLQWARGYFSAEELGGCLSPSSISFDSSVFELFAPLAAGGTVILAPTILQLPDLPSAHQVTFLVTGAPSAVAELLRHATIPRSVRSVLLAGEPVPRDLVDRLYALGHVDTVRNFYGPTEGTVYATGGVVPRDDQRRPGIGRPLANVRAYVLDAARHEVPPGATGELYLGGACLARGYLERPALTSERFVPDGRIPGARMYRTGDLARSRPDGDLEFVGRVDHQIKIRGFRIEPAEIEAALRTHPDVADSVVVGYRPDPAEAAVLVAYVSGRGTAALPAPALREFLARRLPAHLVPTHVVTLPALPHNANGKVDVGSLPPPGPGRPDAAPAAGAAALETRIAAVWRDILGGREVGPEDNFFDVGGHSLLLPRLVRMVAHATGTSLQILDVFSRPTVRALARLVADREGAVARAAAAPARSPLPLPPPLVPAGPAVREGDLAIIGYACRLPASDSPEAFWRNLVEGSDCTGLAPCDRPGWEPAHRLRRGGFLAGIDEFEPEMFRLAPREARAMDPQQRLLLEVAAEAVARSGYRPPALGGGGPVGVFVGATPTDFGRLFADAPPEQLALRSTGSGFSLLANRVSYVLDLRGPSLTVDTACSSSLVALHLARQGILAGDCAAAVVAGVSLLLTPDAAEGWSEAGILAPDGRCKPFSDGADGYGASEGAVALVLRPLAAALRDGDEVAAVLKGTATNHDGHDKLGLTAPSPRAHAAAVAAACRAGEIAPGTVSYVEAHGTGTALGDPLEVAALAEAFGGVPRGSVALGSVKSAIGHCGPAAGLAAVLGAVLALVHGELPPTQHLRVPNRATAFEETPFFVNDRRRPWAPSTIRRAGVSGLGLGGSNAHAVLEEAPDRPARSLRAAAGHVVPLSARTGTALRALARRYRDHLAAHPFLELADIAFTLATGRDVLPRRAAIVATSTGQLIDRLSLLAALPEPATVEVSGLFVDDGDPPGDDDAAGALAAARHPEDVPPGHWPAWLVTLARLYAAGADLPWDALHGGGSPWRVTLPPYPYERRRLSIAAPPPRPATSRIESASRAEPASRAESGGRLHQVHWRPQAAVAQAAVAQPSAEARRWLLLAHDDDLADGLAGRLSAAGHRVSVAHPGDGFRDLGGSRFTVDPGSEQDLQRLLETLGNPLDEVAHLWSAGPGAAGLESLARRLELGPRSALRLVVALDRAGARPRFRLATVGAQPAGGPSPAPEAASLAALVGVLRVERPHLQPSYVDLDRAPAGDLAATLLGEWACGAADPEVTYRAGVRLVPALRGIDPARDRPPLLRRGGAYLVVGGQGGIGASLTRWLADRLEAQVIATGRSPSGRDAFPGLRYIEADVRDLDRMRAVVTEIRARHRALSGVFHLAGAAGHGRIDEGWADAFDEAMGARVRGAWVLDEILRPEDGPLVIFASHAGLRGSAFQAGYAAASRCLDAFATWRAGQGRATVSLDWGGWAGAGMGAAIHGDAGRTHADNLAVLAALREGAEPWLIVDRVTLASPLTVVSPPRPEPSAAARAFLSDLLARELECEPADVPAGQPFLDLGLDSLSAARLVDRINARTGASFPRTLFFDHPTVDRLVPVLAQAWPRHREQVPPAPPVRPAAVVTRAAPVSPSAVAPVPAGPLAVIGMAGRFPGAPNLETFWANLCAGVDAVTPAPPARWDLGSNRFPRPYCTSGAFLDPTVFDPGSFGISVREAEAMDDEQRLLVEVAWTALEDAGYARNQLRGSTTGVFVGAMGSASRPRTAPTPHSLLGSSQALLANRLSYLWDLRGPCMTVDTLCSSSLVAVHLAVRALRSGECEQALVAGVRAGITLDHYVGACEMGALSQHGRCRAFGRGADGIVLGEGAGVLLLKPLARAQADGDHVHGVILGTAVNHGGQASGLTAPSGAAQAAVIRAALAEAAVPAETIGYVEAHGTGTALGDPIEVDGLRAAFGPDVRRQSCVLGSVKTNIGHLESAAGIAGLLKALLVVEAGQLPPTLHLAAVNEAIEFADSPFYLRDRLTAWPRPDNPRRAGVSAFGIGGANAHCVVQQRPADPARSPDRPGADLLTLSARSADLLRGLAGRVGAHLAARHDLALDDVCLSANAGRRDERHRLAVVTTSVTAAGQALRAFAEGGTSPAEARAGAPGTVPRVAFLFTGQGAGPVGAGAELYRSSEVFRGVVQHCAAACGPGRLSAALPDLLSGAVTPAPADVQPVLFVLELATARLWQAMGVAPYAVLGHSLGELVAACVAGSLTVAAALDFAIARGALMAALPAGGAMAAVLADEAAIAPFLDGGTSVCIAAFNGPGSTVISGRRDVLDRVAQQLLSAGLTVHPLDATLAFHSALMDPVLDRLEEAARACPAVPPSCHWASTRTGALMAAAPDPAHWRRQARQPVRFADGLSALTALGCDAFLECGPAATLSTLGRQALPDPALLWCATLGRGSERHEPLLRAARDLYLRGVALDWRSAPANRPRRRVPLPAAGVIAHPSVPPDVPPDVPSDVPPDGPAAARLAEVLPGPALRGVVPAAAPSVVATLQELVAQVLRLPAEAVAPDAPLPELGADSLILTEIGRAITGAFGVQVTARQLLGDLRTVRAIAGHVSGTVPPPAGQPSPAAPGVIRPLPGSAVLPAHSAHPAVLPAHPAAEDLRQPEAGSAPTPEQAAFVRALVTRFSARTPGSRAYAERHRPWLADARNVAGFRMSTKDMLYPIVAARSQGSRFQDIDGNDYLDISMGYGVHLFGHNPPFVVEALRAQLDTGLHLGPLAADAGEVAERLCRVTGLERAAFCNSGTEAVALALRLARTASGRSRIALFEGSYHGFADGTLLGRPARAERAGQAAPIALGIPPGVAGDVLVLPYGTDESLAVIAAQAETLAAVLVEPVQSRRPDFQPTDFLRELRSLTQRSGTFLIFDEVVTGLRAHPAGAQSLFGVRADLATYGKALAAGLPIGAVAGSARCMDGVDGGRWHFGDASHPTADRTFFATTFGKNPLSMAAAKAVLTEVEARGPGLQEKLNATTSRLVHRLNDALAERATGLSVVSFSSLFRFSHGGNLDPLYALLGERGVYVWEGRNLFLSTAHSEPDLDELVAAVAASAEELVSADLLPPPVRQPAPRPPEARGHGGRLPLTDGQRELWVTTQLGAAASAAYHEGVALTLRGRLDLPALTGALEDLVRRHDALRVAFATTGEWQEVTERAAVALEQRDLSRGPLECLAERVRSEVAEVVSRRFSMNQPPLLRAALLTLGADHYVLVLVVHHAVVDGAAFALLLHEIGTFYGGRVAGVPARLPPAVSLAEVVEEWQQRAPQRAAADSRWRRELAGAPGTLSLAFGQARPPLRSFRGGRLRSARGPELAAAVRRVAAERGTTPFRLMLAAFGTWLQQLSGQESIVVGVPHARPSAWDDRVVVAHRLTMLPIVIAAGPDDRFADVLGRCARAVGDAIDLGEGPGIGSPAAGHEPRRGPRFAVEFNIDPTTAAPVFADLDVAVVGTSAPLAPLELPPGAGAAELEVGSAKFDLTLSMALADDGLTAVLEYAADLFDELAIASLAESFWSFLAAVVGDPDLAVDRIPLIGDPDRRALVQANSTARELPDRTITEAVQRWAARDPQRVAASHGAEQLTYGELAARMLALAAELRAAGVGREDVVAVDGTRGLEFLVAVLAVLAAEGAYLPIDGSHPPRRIASLLRRSQPRVLLIPAGTLPGSLSQAVALLAPGERPPVMPASGGMPAPLAGTPAPESLAYVMFTSGSTGAPKGAMVEHAGMQNHLWAKVADLALTETDVVVQNASASFDVSVWQLLAPLLAGARVCIVGDADARDPARLLAAVDQGATVLEVVPSMLRELLATLEARRGAAGASALRWLISTGEALPPQLCRRWAALRPEVPILNAYGPTECSDDVCHHVVSQPVPASARRVPVGRPIANLRVYVLDRARRPLPAGVPGELWVAGLGVGRGYLNDEVRTREAFAADPLASWFPDAPAPARAYRTGDLARWTTGGEFEFLGRRDGQVKLAGRRVATGEIEALLEQHDAVGEAAVVTSGEAGEQRLVGYVTSPRLAAAADRAAVDDWRAVFEDVHAEVRGLAEPDAVRRVWTNSYTGAPLDPAEVGECLDQAAARILELRPRSVLEIGCGIGLLAQRLISHLDAYRGIDLSPAAVAEARERLGAGARARFAVGAADDLQALDLGAADVVILNEVVQYFPSQAYLRRVLAVAVKSLTAGGAVFVGSVRNQQLLRHFHASVALCRAQADASVETVRAELENGLAREPELAVPPSFFTGIQATLPSVADVRVCPHGGRARNEITSYRYDAVLRTSRLETPPVVRWLPAADVPTLSALRRAVAGCGDEAVGVQHLANARLAESRRILAALNQDPAAAAAGLRRPAGDGDDGLDPCDVLALGEELGRHVELSWATGGADGSFGAILSTVPLTGSQSPWPAVPDAGPADPAHSPVEFRRAGAAAADLRRFLAARLPSTSVPATFVILDRMPRTVSGKVDRSRLPRAIARESRAGRGPRPAGSAIARIAAVWAAALHAVDVADDGNFFELGGDSLRAIQVMRGMERDLGVRLPLQALFEAPTLAEFAAAAAAAWPARRSALVPVQPAGHLAPLVLVHPAGGNVLCYAELARHLGRDRPLLGLQSFGLDDNSAPLRAVPAMAHRYLQSVHGRLGRPPDLLGGWSLGGVVAFEMAQQLRAAGHPVQALLLLDADLRPGPEPGLDREVELLTMFQESIGISGALVDPRELAALAPQERLRRQFAAGRDAGALAAVTVDGLARLFEVFEGNVSALWSYAPAPYEGPITLYRAEGSAGPGIDPLLGWGAVSGAVELQAVPGTHVDLMRMPHVARLAGLVSRRLAAL